MIFTYYRQNIFIIQATGGHMGPVGVIYVERPLDFDKDYVVWA